jgi:flagellar biosynthesis/type III secretory pathway ATPase
MADQAIDRIDRIRDFLRQPTDEYVSFEDTLALMKKSIA